jgi:hypothetical protein
MAISEIPIEATTEILGAIGKLGLYLQAIGAVVIIWLGFLIANFINNRKTRKTIQKMDLDIQEIKKLLKKRK